MPIPARWLEAAEFDVKYNCNGERCDATIPGPSGSTISLGVSGSIASQIASVFAAELAAFSSAGQLSVDKVTNPIGIPTPTLPHELLIINDTTPGATFFVPKGFDFVFNESSVPITIVTDPASSTQIITPASFTGDDPPGSTTVYGGSGGGSDVSENGNNLFQALATGGGQYFVAFGAGDDTIWATSGDNVLDAGAGNNLIGLGSGNNFVASQGSDTILAGSGTNTVIAGSGASDLIFGSSGGLLFVGGGAGTSSTIIGGAGNETLFGGGGSGLFFADSGSFLLTNQGGSDTVVAGAGDSSVAVFGGSGGSVNLFSSTDGNVLVAGAGNETLNAAGSTGTATLWAGAGNDSLAGGSGSDIFAFVTGVAHGVDTISGWTAKDTLALIGYGSGGIVNQSDVGGNALITLSDGTTINFTGVPHVPNSHITLT